jgi:hypothetical protein
MEDLQPSHLAQMNMHGFIKTKNRTDVTNK